MTDTNRRPYPLNLIDDLRSEIEDAERVYGHGLSPLDNLRGANLYGADLRGADLSNADLRYADLCDANLYGAIGVPNA